MQREIGVAQRLRPNRVDVFGQYHHRVDRKRVACLDDAHRLAQGADILRQKAASPVQEIDGEEPASPRSESATIIRYADDDKLSLTDATRPAALTRVVTSRTMSWERRNALRLCALRACAPFRCALSRGSMVFERLRLNWKIRRLRRQKDENIGVTIRAIYEVAHETGAIPDNESIRKEILNSIELGRQIDEHIAILESNYWLDRAEHYLLRTPDDLSYIPSKLDKRFHYFDEETLASLRCAVRKNQKERSESFRTWAMLAVCITSAGIGFVAMLKK